MKPVAHFLVAVAIAIGLVAAMLRFSGGLLALASAACIVLGAIHWLYEAEWFTIPFGMAFFALFGDMPLQREDTELKGLFEVYLWVMSGPAFAWLLVLAVALYLAGWWLDKYAA
jgi:glucan phosphoethanolaminetransferase (alkaline phosphatase superfamily)